MDIVWLEGQLGRTTQDKLNGMTSLKHSAITKKLCLELLVGFSKNIFMLRYETIHAYICVYKCVDSQNYSTAPLICVRIFAGERVIGKVFTPFLKIHSVSNPFKEHYLVHVVSMRRHSCRLWDLLVVYEIIVYLEDLPTIYGKILRPSGRPWENLPASMRRPSGRL